MLSFCLFSGAFYLSPLPRALSLCQTSFLYSSSLSILCPHLLSWWRSHVRESWLKVVQARRKVLGRETFESYPRLHPFLCPPSNLMELPINTSYPSFPSFYPSQCLWYGLRGHWHTTAISFYSSLLWFFILDYTAGSVVRETILKCSLDRVKTLLEIFNDLLSPKENLQAPKTPRPGSGLIQTHLSVHSLATRCSLHSQVSHSSQKILFLSGGAMSFFTGPFKQDYFDKNLFLPAPICERTGDSLL